MATEAQAVRHECGKVEPVFVAEPPAPPAVTTNLMIQLALERIADGIEQLVASLPLYVLSGIPTQEPHT